MSLSESENSRLVPYRFAFKDSDADICKLEKLTNLFPDMKALIELELFKMNNLQHAVDRLSRIYTPTQTVDIHDGTQHIFFGPYHISFGSTTFGALHFRNISTALLKSTKISDHNTTQQQKRRHHAALRRFRRSVRKLILIKSIIDQLRLASILTPYNQYELYKRGIYDLVLAGHLHKAHSVFEDEEFTEWLDDFRLTNQCGKDNLLLTSKFIKIQTLFHLLAPTPHQQHTDNNLTSGEATETTLLDDKTNEKPSKSLIDPSTICCPQHVQNMPQLMFPLNRSVSYQATQFLSSKPHLRRNSNSNTRRNSSVSSRQNIRKSLPNLNINDINNTIESKTLVVHPSPQEDAFVNRISTLLTNYVLSQQSTTIPNHTSHNHEKLGDSIESIASSHSAIGSDDGDVFNQYSSATSPNDFDKLIKRIKKVVNNNLSDHQNSTKPTASTDLRQKLLKSRTVSHPETSKDELDGERVKSVINKPKLLHSSKSQSFDETNLKLSLIASESYDSVEF